MTHRVFISSAVPVTSEKTFAEAAASYLKHGGDGKHIQPIIDHFGNRPLASIFPFDVKEMASALYPTQSNATRNRQALTPARAVINHGYERGDVGLRIVSIACSFKSNFDYHRKTNLSEPDQVLRQIIPYCVTFLSPGKDKYGIGLFPAGSGAFVSIGGIRGIITASHVIRGILTHRDCGLLIFNEQGKKAPRLLFAPEERDTIQIGLEDRPDGPDIGFLRIPFEIEGWLLSKVQFYNFDKRLELANEMAPELPHEIVAGTIYERSFNKSSTSDRRTDVHTLTRAYGQSFNARKNEDGLDIFDLLVSHSDEVPYPDTYGGLSGGAVWAAGDQPGVNNLLLRGVVFYEQFDNDFGRKHLVCHGPSTIYGELADQVIARFSVR